MQAHRPASDRSMNLLDPEFNYDDFEVKVSELLVATAEHADALIDDNVAEVLRLLRERLHMDVVFVAEFLDGQRIFRQVDAAEGSPHVIEVGQSGPLERSWCKRVVDGRMPRLIARVPGHPAAEAAPQPVVPIGAFMSTPIVLSDGQVYGTLCCFSFTEHPELQEKDLRKLEMSAQLAARRIDASRQQLATATHQGSGDGR